MKDIVLKILCFQKAYFYLVTKILFLLSHLLVVQNESLFFLKNRSFIYRIKHCNFKFKIIYTIIIFCFIPFVSIQ